MFYSGYNNKKKIKYSIIENFELTKVKEKLTSLDAKIFKNRKQNGKMEGTYHSQGGPFDVLFVLDHCGKSGFSVNKYNKKVSIKHRNEN